jgi:hypothetical protein
MGDSADETDGIRRSFDLVAEDYAEHFFDDYRGTPIDVTLRYHQPEALADAVRRAGFTVDAVETRPPYEFEHPTPRLYVSGAAQDAPPPAML